MNRRSAIAGIALIALATFTVIGVQSLFAQQNPPQAASVQLQDAAGNSVGMVILTAQNDKVLMVANVNGLTPGFHGFHIHTTGSCESNADGMFMAAGGHLNPTGAEHPNHAGDLPALLVNADGTAFLSFETDRFTMADILDADGSAIMIHSDADNYANIPDRYVVTPGLVTATPEGTPAPSGVGGVGTSLADEETKRVGDTGEPLACGVVTETIIELPVASATPTGSETATIVPAAITATPGEVTATPADVTITATVEGTVEGTVEVTPDGTTTPATPEATATSELPTTPTLQSILPTPSFTPAP